MIGDRRAGDQPDRLVAEDLVLAAGQLGLPF